jgi:hypothetical protein
MMNDKHGNIYAEPLNLDTFVANLRPEPIWDGVSSCCVCGNDEKLWDECYRCGSTLCKYCRGQAPAECRFCLEELDEESDESLTPNIHMKDEGVPANTDDDENIEWEEDPILMSDSPVRTG